MAPRIEQSRLLNNPFSLGPYEVDLRLDSYTVRVGKTELHLGLEELGVAHDFGDHYRLDHKCGFVLYLPKSSLSDTEEQVIASYREKFPGRPENTATPEY